MSWVPHTLLSRLMLLIALLLAAAQFAAFRLFDYFEREPRATAKALQVVSVVNLTRTALLAAREELRIPLLAELSQIEGIRVYPIDLFEEVEPLPDEAMVQLVAEKVRAQLGARTLISVNHLGLPGLWVSFSIHGEDFWVVVPNVKGTHATPKQWVGWAVLLLVIALAGGYVIAARINRPLRLLVQAADQVARGQAVQKLPEYGVQELQQVSRTFNAMTDALARLDAERTLLLAGVSHDLRTPLARLRLAVEMLPQQDQLKIGMIQDIEDMDGIVRQFLDFVRGLEGEPVALEDLNALVRSVVARYGRSGHDVAFVPGQVPNLRLRHLAMHRLIGNLLDNALHYGRSPVEVTTGETDGQVVLRVLDRGSGIPEHEMSRLLRPFERMDVARGQESSCGLGLAIADRIARMHGGVLSLHNRHGGGLEARLTLPLPQ